MELTSLTDRADVRNPNSVDFAHPTEETSSRESGPARLPPAGLLLGAMPQTFPTPPQLVTINKFAYDEAQLKKFFPRSSDGSPVAIPRGIPESTDRGITSSFDRNQATQLVTNANAIAEFQQELQTRFAEVANQESIAIFSARLTELAQYIATQGNANSLEIILTGDRNQLKPWIKKFCDEKYPTCKSVRNIIETALNRLEGNLTHSNPRYTPAEVDAGMIDRLAVRDVRTALGLKLQTAKNYSTALRIVSRSLSLRSEDPKSIKALLDLDTDSCDAILATFQHVRGIGPAIGALRDSLMLPLPNEAVPGAPSSQKRLLPTAEQPSDQPGTGVNKKRSVSRNEAETRNPAPARRYGHHIVADGDKELIALLSPANQRGGTSPQKQPTSSTLSAYRCNLRELSAMLQAYANALGSLTDSMPPSSLRELLRLELDMDLADQVIEKAGGKPHHKTAYRNLKIRYEITRQNAHASEAQPVNGQSGEAAHEAPRQGPPSSPGPLGSERWQ